MLNAYFTRASSIILLTAHNPAFRQFYAAAGDRDAAGAARRSRSWTRSTTALGYLEQLYPDRIGEACFIDAAGAENARMVRGRARRATPTCPRTRARTRSSRRRSRCGRDQVYQAKPYVSPDTDEWVISNSTLVPTPDGSKPAIVHFEVTLDSFRREAIAHSDRTGPGRRRRHRPGGDQLAAAAADRRAAGRPDRHPVPRPGRAAGATTGRLAARRAPGRLPADRADARQRQPLVRGVRRQRGDRSADRRRGPADRAGRSPHCCSSPYLLVALRRGQKALVDGGEHRRADRAVQPAAAGRRPGPANWPGPPTADPLLLMLCDLNGFKAYNDTFGHPAGDALLARLGAALTRELGGRGRAYRIGGDEFCVLARPGRDRHRRDHRASPPGRSASTARASRSPPRTAPSCCPTTRPRPPRRCALVDLRMYENKNSGRVPADAQTTNALLRAIHERDPQWAERLVSDRRPGRRGVPAARPAGRRGGPDPAGGPAARRRQGRHPRRDPAQARTADRRRSGRSSSRRPSIGERIISVSARAGPGRPAGPLGAGTLRRHRLPRRPGRRGHPARRPDHRRLRRAGRHDHRPALRRPARHRQPPWTSSAGPQAPNSTRRSSTRSTKSPCSPSPPDTFRAQPAEDIGIGAGRAICDRRGGSRCAVPRLGPVTVPGIRLGPEGPAVQPRGRSPLFSDRPGRGRRVQDRRRPVARP